MSLLTDKLRRMADGVSDTYCSNELKLAAAIIEGREAHLDTVESMRDRFAMTALQGLLANHRPHEPKNLAVIAKSAYLFADAMLAARGAE